MRKVIAANIETKEIDIIDSKVIDKDLLETILSSISPVRVDDIDYWIEGINDKIMDEEH